MAAYPKKLEADEIVNRVTSRYIDEQVGGHRHGGVARTLSRQVRILAEVLVEAINDANHHNGHDSSTTESNGPATVGG